MQSVESYLGTQSVVTWQEPTSFFFLSYVNWLSFDFCVYKPSTLSSLFMPHQDNKSGIYFLLLQEKDQKAYDLKITAAEYHLALELYHHIKQQSTYDLNIPDLSLFLAHLQCWAAENMLTMVQRYYEWLEANASIQAVGTALPSSPTKIDYFAYFESPPLTPVDGHASTLQDGLPSPLTYASLDIGPSIPTPSQAPVIPSTPTRQGTQPHIAPTTPSQLHTATTTSLQPHGMPTTPNWFNTAFNIASPQTPNRKRSITVSWLGDIPVYTRAGMILKFYHSLSVLI